MILNHDTSNDPQIVTMEEAKPVRVLDLGAEPVLMGGAGVSELGRHPQSATARPGLRDACVRPFLFRINRREETD